MHPNMYSVTHWGKNNLLATGIRECVYILEFEGEEAGNPDSHPVSTKGTLISAIRWMEPKKDSSSSLIMAVGSNDPLCKVAVYDALKR